MFPGSFQAVISVTGQRFGQIKLCTGLKAQFVERETQQGIMLVLSRIELLGKFWWYPSLSSIQATVQNLDRASGESLFLKKKKILPVL